MQQPPMPRPPVSDRLASVWSRRTGQPFISIQRADGQLRSYTYQAFTMLAGLIAVYLGDRGLRPGARVLICMPHQTSLYAAMYAVILRGGVPVIMAPPNPKTKPEDYARMMSSLESELEADLIIANDEYIGSFEGRGASVVTASEVANVSGRVQTDIQGIAEHDTILIQYSSGTTGLKKGVEISQRALLNQVDAYTRAIGFDENSVVCNWLPMYHDMGLVCCFWLPMLTGARVIHMSNFAWLSNPEAFLAHIEEERATHIWLPNFALSYMARWYNPERHGIFDLSSLKMITNCSEPVTAAARAAFLEAFACCGISAEQMHSSFAMAETTFAMTTTTAEAPQRVVSVDPSSLRIEGEVRPGERQLVSSGVAIAGTRLRIAGDSSRELPENTFGRIQARSQSLASKYFKDRVDLASRVDDGFFDTGDLGFLRDGHLYVVGRADDMIVAHGENHDPGAIEESLLDVEGVIPGRAVAFGAPVGDSATNEIVILCESRVTAPDERLELEAEIKKHVLSAFNIMPAVARVQPPGSLTKSTSGKIARPAARRAYLETRENIEKPGPSGDGFREPLERFMEERFGLTGDRKSGNRLLSEGLIDSLGVVELCLFLEEQTGHEIPLPNEIGFDRFESLDEIERLVEGVKNGEISRRGLIAVGNDLVERKVRTIQNEPHAYNAFLLASSTFKMLPSALLDGDGRAYFNFSYGGATLPDFVAVIGFLRETLGDAARLDTVLISLDIERISGFVHTPAAATIARPELYEAFENRLGAIDRDAYIERMSATRKGRLQDRLLFGDYAEDFLETAGKNGDIRLTRAGEDVAAFMFREELLASGLTGLKMRLNRSVQIPIGALREMTKRLRLAAEGFVGRVVFVLPPLQPDCWSELSKDRDYHAETDRVLSVINQVFENKCEILDHRDIRTFDGDPEDFKDATHAGPGNARKLALAMKARLYGRAPRS